MNLKFPSLTSNCWRHFQAITVFYNINTVLWLVVRQWLYPDCPPAVWLEWSSDSFLRPSVLMVSVCLQKTGRLYTVEPTDQYPSVHSEMTQWQRPMINRGSGCQGITTEAPHRQIRRLGGCVVINDRRYRNWPGKLLTSLAQHRGIDLG